MTIQRILLSLASIVFVGLAGACAYDDDKSNSGMQDTQPMSSGGMADATVNDKCPISGEAVDPSVDTVSYSGHEVGFCCASCPGDFRSWSDQKKADFVSKASMNN